MGRAIGARRGMSLYERQCRAATEAERAEVLRLYFERGMSSHDVGDRLGLANTTVLEIIRAEGLEPRGYGPPRIVDPDVIAAQYVAGLSSGRIAQIHGIHPGTVTYALRKLGVRTRARSFYRQEKSAAWRGGRVLTARGYVLVSAPNHPRARHAGYVPEHILVMEGIIGGPVPEGYDVHHRNGIKSDNRPENLELLTKAEHTRLHWRERRRPDSAAPAGRPTHRD